MLVIEVVDDIAEIDALQRGDETSLDVCGLLFDEGLLFDMCGLYGRRRLSPKVFQALSFRKER